MTYRERREAKAERLREWADKREAKAEAGREGEHAILGMIPLGQPILVGHHSERRHRRDLERADAKRRAARDDAAKADEFRSRADNIERAAEQAIYSDDEDAIERLREKLADLEARREAMKARNAEFRKAHRAELKDLSAYQRDDAIPHPGYELRNLGGNITRTRNRIAHLEREAEAIDAGDRGTGKQMAARYAGACADCGSGIDHGDSMTYYRRTREVICEACSAAAGDPDGKRQEGSNDVQGQR